MEVYHTKNCTIRVHRPNLTPEEREKRIKEMVKATEDFFKADEREKKKAR